MVSKKDRRAVTVVLDGVGVGYLPDAGEYGDDVISEAFIRSHDEPGRAWNMDEWNARHREQVR